MAAVAAGGAQASLADHCRTAAVGRGVVGVEGSEVEDDGSWGRRIRGLAADGDGADAGWSPYGRMSDSVDGASLACDDGYMSNSSHASYASYSSTYSYGGAGGDRGGGGGDDGGSGGGGGDAAVSCSDFRV
jgi:hypothetical protein